jgi:cytoskeleton protein RodZ
MMATGNAGGIEILVDGKAVPQLGPVGVIRRNVALDAESLLKGVAATP